ncbi:hypothetical protein [Aromatoleum diolicum]|uniref:Integron gene cassette protein n=1 Tax=Aromatoleum diolicum TaxID=75796 RepID=A0ABX1QCW1_9RHOO|nr:hypothetical protein [Aromatoleum diolicum]NMG76237.1 hypothetical protein [Aromatoleum diolicum]
MASLLAFAPGCTAVEPPDGWGSVLPDESSCDREARLLKEEVEVFAAPESGLKPVKILVQGRFVYRCEQRNGWLGVMFPGDEEKVDCSHRTAEIRCFRGWIRQDIRMEILGWAASAALV